MFDVSCVGILVADIIADSVSEMPKKGKLTLVDNLSMFAGGCAANAAIDMGKIGQKVAVIGRVGNDGFGNFLDSKLKEANVNTDGLVFSSTANTSSSVAFIESDGERSFLHSYGANGEFDYSDIDFNIIKASKIVFVAGSLLMPNFDESGCMRLLKKSKELDKITVLDTAWDPTKRWFKTLSSSMPYIDYFMPSYEEAVKLSGRVDLDEIANFFLTKGVLTVVIKNGSKGCFIKTSKGITYNLPIYKNVKVKDTTGAGDSFCAGFITGLIKKLPIEECAKLGNAVGAHCVMEVGATSGIPNYEALISFMNKY